MAISLKAKQREDLSRGATNEIRNDGGIPSVVYGKGEEAVTISVNNLELLKTLRDEGRNAIITLDVENGDTVDVMLHEYQTDPVKGDVIHADFYVVDMTEEMDIAVPVRLEGDAVGTRDGGVLQQPLYELQIRVKPRDIPEEIVVNIEELEIGNSIAVSDLPISDVYEYLDDEETTVAVVLAPQEEELEPAEDVDFSAEPELVGAEDDEEEDVE
ncbi:MAG TPA: 50S ribosomal protein L25/general stress protein Ctc [Pseudogracilibacillus sp.]|nr:50S ribosomal protein L25/general stress protein Ctc [Pseudogracilibacillus sp.]